MCRERADSCYPVDYAVMIGSLTSLHVESRAVTRRLQIVGEEVIIWYRLNLEVFFFLSVKKKLTKSLSKFGDISASHEITRETFDPLVDA